MSTVDELVSILLEFTPEQLNQFLDHPITELILQPEEASESYLLGAS